MNGMTNELPQPGWYADPHYPGYQRYWDGTRWTDHRVAREQKSAGVAALLTVLWPGAGHLYLGLKSKGMPYFVINAVALALWLILWVFLPVGVVVWIVTLCMTIGSIADETRMVNGQSA